jgi:putative addiction module component (TIGR02574 family)
MTATAKSLLESALALPESERMAIAEALFESLPGDIGDLDDDALEQELLRRSEELDKDPSSAIPWSEVKRRISQGDVA